MKVKMEFYKDLTRPSNIIIELCYSLLRAHNINVTRSYLKRELEMHPDYPSILSLGDTLRKLKVQNISARLSLEKLKKMLPPFLVSLKNIKDDTTYFSLVTSLDESILETTNIEGKGQKLTWDQFDELYNGVAFLIEKTEKSGEEDYKTKKFKENLSRIALDVSLLLIPFSIFLNIAIFFYEKGLSESILPITYQILSLVGWSSSLFIIWYEIDQNNKALKKVCGIDQGASSCGVVFHSAAGTIFDFTWGNIGFAYFSFILFIQVFSQLTNSSIEVFASLASIMAFLFVPFSLWYQKFVVKQWCRLCLTVQAVLFLQFIVVLFEKKLSKIGLITEDKLSLLFSLIVGGLIPLLLTKQLSVLLKERRDLIRVNKELNKSRFTTSTFISMLNIQKEIAVDTSGLGIFLGSPDAKYKIIKICSPFCGPCAAMHNTIEEMLDDRNFSVQIIFTASLNSDDPALDPVRYFLSIAQQGDEKITRKVLHDWYSSPVKDYKNLHIYPMDSELKCQDVNIKKMWDWCNKMQIAFTPTFFINGRQLPEFYTISEAAILLGS